jgi:hypothetical protein
MISFINYAAGSTRANTSLSVELNGFTLGPLSAYVAALRKPFREGLEVAQLPGNHVINPTLLSATVNATRNDGADIAPISVAAFLGVRCANAALEGFAVSLSPLFDGGLTSDPDIMLSNVVYRDVPGSRNLLMVQRSLVPSGPSTSCTFEVSPSPLVAAVSDLIVPQVWAGPAIFAEPRLSPSFETSSLRQSIQLPSGLIQATSRINYQSTPRVTSFEFILTPDQFEGPYGGRALIESGPNTEVLIAPNLTTPVIQQIPIGDVTLVHRPDVIHGIIQNGIAHRAIGTRNKRRHALTLSVLECL